jgi:hypothetical protein
MARREQDPNADGIQEWRENATYSTLRRMPSLRALRPCRYHRSRKDSAEHEKGDEVRGTEQREDDPHEGACPEEEQLQASRAGAQGLEDDGG